MGREKANHGQGADAERCIEVRSITVRVQGDPAPKGSMKAFVTRSKSGKYSARMVHDNSKTKPWQKLIESAIMQELRRGKDTGPWDCAVRVSCRFIVQRPKTGKAAKRRWPSTKPDVDKLTRTIFDALEGTIIKNDSRVVELHASKEYETAVLKPGVTLTVEKMK